MNDRVQEAFIASCVFTERFPEVSTRVQAYMTQRWDMPVMRCCVPKYRIAHFEEVMPDWLRPQWSALPSYLDVAPGGTVYYLCHNCRGMFMKTQPEVRVKSLWELILEDESFGYPDYQGEAMAVQDCWRSREDYAEQMAVREVLARMNVQVVELPERFEQTIFCGYSFYQPASSRNAELAPKRYGESEQGLFREHAEEEKAQFMRKHCATIPTDKVVAYCHYCYAGLELGDKQALHLAEMLFPR